MENVILKLFAIFQIYECTTFLSLNECVKTVFFSCAKPFFTIIFERLHKDPSDIVTGISKHLFCKRKKGESLPTTRRSFFSKNQQPKNLKLWFLLGQIFLLRVFNWNDFWLLRKIPPLLVLPGWCSQAGGFQYELN